MTDCEWERGRLPSVPDATPLWRNRPRRTPIDDYIALEHPREGVHWVVKAAFQREPESRTTEGAEVKKPPKPGSART
jgi:hypothetical protein